MRNIAKLENEVNVIYRNSWLGMLAVIIIFIVYARMVGGEFFIPIAICLVLFAILSTVFDRVWGRRLKIPVAGIKKNMNGGVT